MSIVNLNAKFYPEIINLWEASVRASHHFLTADEISYYKPLVLKYALPESELYGIIHKQRLAGFIGIRSDKIEMLFVHPDFFGQGLGTLLLKHALHELNCTKIDVNEENPKAYQFYLKHGFKLISRDELDDNGKPHPILHLQIQN